MDINKAQITTDGNQVTMSMPLCKIDEERRIVSGWATLDSVDTQDDVISAEASRKAFENFRGNIRLMHQPIPAGKLVSFREDSFFDAKTEKMYSGIFVDAYISKGAQNIWEMVLDGTLTGFSVMGPLKKSRTEFNKELNKAVRVVEEYDMVELSLVDSPANPMANIVSIAKMADGSEEITGLATEANIENVFWCEKDQVAKVNSDTDANCAVCDNSMANIGWFEADPSERVSKIASIVRKFASKNNSNTMEPVVINVTATDVNPAVIESAVNQILNGKNGGVVKMAENDANPVSDTDRPGFDEATNAIEEDVVAEPVVEAEPVTEDVVEAPNLEKMFGDLKDTIEKGLASVTAGNAEALDAVKGDLEELSKAFESKFSALNQQHTELVARVESVTGEIGAVEKRIDGVVSETALKKSGDLGSESEDTLKKSDSKSKKWNGSFLGTDIL